MSDSPIFDSVNSGNIIPIEPTPEPEPKAWWQKLLNPTFRRWAYGVSAAALIAGATWAGKPEFIPIAAPLVMAIFYVDANGTPNAN